MLSKCPDFPLVSVHMVFRNAGRFIQEALNSVFSQTVQNFELICVDDGSTDDTKAKLETFQDSRIRYFKNNGSGVGAARQLALLHSRGEWVAVFDADDISLPKRLELSLGLAQTGKILVGGQMDEISEEGVSLGRHRFFPSDERQIRTRLGAGYSLCHGASLYQASIAREVGGYLTRLKQIGEDEDLFVRLAQRGGVGNLEETLILRRIHRKSICTQFQKTQWVLSSFLFSDSQLTESAYFARLGKSALKGRKPVEAFRFYLKSLMICPGKTNACLGAIKSFLELTTEKILVVKYHVLHSLLK